MGTLVSDARATTKEEEPAVDPELSIVMPCLDEARTLPSCIGKARGFLEQHGVAGEVIVADNGSTDGSQAIAEGLHASFTLGAGQFCTNPGVVFVALGLALSVLVVRETKGHAVHESTLRAETEPRAERTPRQVFWDTTLRNPNLSCISQAGLDNNWILEEVAKRQLKATLVYVDADPHAAWFRALTTRVDEEGRVRRFGLVRAVAV